MLLSVHAGSHLDLALIAPTRGQSYLFALVLVWVFRDFLVRNGLIDAETGVPLVRFCWCTDGPWDIRDFVVKQCFISKVGASFRCTVSHRCETHSIKQIPIPHWVSGDVMDVRRLVGRWLEKHVDPAKKTKPQVGRITHVFNRAHATARHIRAPFFPLPANYICLVSPPSKGVSIVEST